jgi:glycosyltransferase involved in cell wall biosynthesis
VSQSTADWSVTEEGLDRRRLLVIPNGIDRSKIEDEASRPITDVKIPTVQNILLFVGRLHEQKGIDVLIAQGDRILGELPSHDLVIVGDGPWSSQVESYRQRSIHASRIHVLGHRQDVAAWMKRSQLVILPTRYEGMPNVILEAMSLGRAVVTTDVEGVAELLGDDPTQMIPKDDWNHWAERVIELGRDAQRCGELGQSNQKRAHDDFALNTQLQRYVNLYEEIFIGRHGSAGTHSG